MKQQQSNALLVVLAASYTGCSCYNSTPWRMRKVKVKLRRNKRLSKRMCVVDGRYVQMKSENADDSDLATITGPSLAFP